MKQILFKEGLFKFALFVGLIMMISSCKKSSTDDVALSGGTGQFVDAKVKAVVANYVSPILSDVSSSSLKANSIVDTVINLGDGNVMIASLLLNDTNSLKNVAKSGSNKSDNLQKASSSNVDRLSMYKVFLFTKNPNKLVEERTYIAGLESQTEKLFLEKGVHYKVVGISLNDKSYLDNYVVRNGERYEDFIFKLANTDEMANKDMLFVSNDVYVDPSATSYDLPLNFKHLFSLINLSVEANFNDFGNYISSIDIGLNVRGHKGVEKPFSTDAIVRPSTETYYLQMPPFSGLNTSSIIKSSTIANTDNIKGTDNFFVTIKSMRIGTKNYGNLSYFKNQEILPGKSYTLRVRLTSASSSTDVSAGGKGNVLVDEEGQQTVDKNLTL